MDISGFSNRPIDAFTTRDLVVVLESEDDVAHYKPNFDELIKIDEFHAVIVTAQSSDSGYVLRYFAPKIGISEDLATASAAIIPLEKNHHHKPLNWTKNCKKSGLGTLIFTLLAVLNPLYGKLRLEL